jgi:hypothetical protein
MARIRTIKPEFPQSETIGKLSRDARLLFIQLWTVADDSGRARGNVAYLSGALFPYDDDAKTKMKKWLGELDAAGCIRQYEVDGKQYLDIPSFLKHQRIDKPSESRLPAFQDASKNTPRIVDEPSPTDLVPSNGPRKGPVPSTSAAPDGAQTVREPLVAILGEELADGVIDHRKRLRKPLTPFAAKLLAGKFESCPDPPAAAQAMIANGWQGIEPSWMKHDKPSDLQRRTSLAREFLTLPVGGTETGGG